LKIRVDTKFLEGELANKSDFQDENDWIFGKKVVVDPGDSATMKAGQIITARNCVMRNSLLKRRDKRLIDSRMPSRQRLNRFYRG